MHELPMELDDGLVMRRARPEDAEPLAAFNALVHENATEDLDTNLVAAMTRDLMVPGESGCGPDNFLVVEESASGLIVSSLCYVSQTWTFAGIPVEVGQPEIVGTLEAFRRRRLVRRQFEVIHEWGRERGHLMQVITGIPWYYRLFGYEMTLDLHSGMDVLGHTVPKPKDGEEERFTIRAAEERDLPFLVRMHGQMAARSVFACPRDEAQMRYELLGRSEHSGVHYRNEVVEEAGEPVGWLLRAKRPDFTSALAAYALEFVPDRPMYEPALAVARHLLRTAASLEQRGTQPGVALTLGQGHPVYGVLAAHLSPSDRRYTFFVRVPDVAAFLERVRPALEARLAASPMAGYTGALHIGWYRDGVRLAFEDGRLAEIPRGAPDETQPHANFPEPTLLHLLTGYRSLTELRRAFADCGCTPAAVPLVNALFPKRASHVWPWI